MPAMLMRKILYLFIFCLSIQSCTRKEIQFGDNPESSYTNIVFNDTVSVVLSTVLSDSFVTNNASSFLLGKYRDPWLGTVAAKAFFQMTIPTSVASIPSSAQYDSLTFIFRPDNYYYGDTSKAQTFYVNELSETITHSYNNSLYNTSNIPVKSGSLGSKTILIRPASNDSVQIRLNDAKGSELFSKLRDLSTDVSNAEQFLNYFKGISLTTTDNDTTAIYRLKGSAGAMVMRVHYHTTIPYPVKEYIDFTGLANEYSFNQVLTNRSGTGIVSGSSGVTEVHATQTNDHSFLQPGTGIYLKMIFPSLRSIAITDKIIKLLKAELIIKPAYLSFDRNQYKLPSPLYLSLTDGTNLIGDEVADSTGTGVQYAAPVVDELYGENNYYRFNVTPYVNHWISTAGTEDDGFFVMHSASASAMNVNRLIANNSTHGNQGSKLLLSFIVINK